MEIFGQNTISEYADDIVIIGGSQNGVEIRIKNLKTAFQPFILRVNQKILII